MPINDFLPFATNSSANVMNQSDYAVLPARTGGFLSGTARSEQLNKAWRQSSVMAAVLAQFIADGSGNDVLDDGDLDIILDNFLLAIQAVIDSGASNAGYLIASNNLSDLADLVEARDNLQLGSAATLDAQSNKLDVEPGSLMRVGAFGLGGPAISLTDQNIGELDEFSALYYVSNGSDGPEPGFYGWVRVSAITPGQYAFQEAYTTAGDMFTRSMHGGGVFSPWLKLLTDGSSPDPLAGVPIGVPIFWPHAAPPSGGLAMNGQSFNPVAFPQLALMYPTYTLPDMRAEWFRGWDGGRGVDLGRALLSWQDSMLERHLHTAQVGVGNNILDGGGVPAPTVGTSPTSETGGDETRPRNVAFNIICKAE